MGARARGLPVDRGHRRSSAVAGRRARRTRPGRGCSTTPTSCSTCARRRATRSCAIEGLDTPVGPGSTIAAVALVNEIKVRTARAARASAGAMPPVHHERGRRGRRASRAELFDAAYAEHARRLARHRCERRSTHGGGAVYVRHESTEADRQCRSSRSSRGARGARGGAVASAAAAARQRQRRHRRQPGSGKTDVHDRRLQHAVGNGWREEMICAVKAQALASGKVSKVTGRQPERRRPASRSPASAT